MPCEQQLMTSLTRTGEREFVGHAVDLLNTDRRMVVTLRVDGVEIAVTIARLHDADLEASGVGDGCYGFVFALAPEVSASAHVVTAEIANTHIAVGDPIAMDDPAPRRARAGAGRVEPANGIRLSGWLQGDLAANADVVAVHAGEIVAAARATRWDHIERGAGPEPVLRFELQLPSAFADGATRSVVVRTTGGQKLAGSPVVVSARIADNRDWETPLRSAS